MSKIKREVFTYKQRFIFLSIIPLYFMLIGFCIQSPKEIFLGLGKIISAPDLLITDYFAVGGVGAALINAGILALFVLIIHYFVKVDFDGHTITSCCMMFGFSLFGKNIANIWFILLGVLAYTKIHRVSSKKYLYIGFYGTCLSPIITQIMYVTYLEDWQQLLISIFIGFVIGYVLVPIATHTLAVHKGYSLYNIGFAAGIIATIIASILKSFGISIESRLIWTSEYTELFSVVLLLFFTFIMLCALFMGKDKLKEEYKLLLKESGFRGKDFINRYSDYTIFFNMAINGVVSTLFVLAVGGVLNGPIIGSIFTIVGFSANGKHIRNILPIMFGVYIASLMKLWVINEPAPLMTLILSTTLAPIAGEFGILAGILAGFLHSSVVLNVGVVYSGINLYNNGFAGGLVALFLVPVIEALIERKKTRK